MYIFYLLLFLLLLYLFHDYLDIYYFRKFKSTQEVDFLVQTNHRIIPIEVKAEVNLRAKSLKTYNERFSPDVSIRTSMSDYKKEDWLINLPLYAIDQILKEIK